jgi:epoxyqueuosine reductase QueG
MSDDNNQWVIDFLHDKDIALVGFADLSEIDSEARQGLLYGICMAIALQVFPATDKRPSIDYFAEYKRINRQRKHLTQDIIAAITERGYKAANAAIPQDKNYRTPLPLKTIATRAGLGWIGKSGTLITKEYGNAVRIVGILTDMPLETATPVNESMCGTCDECVRLCPGGAIKGNLWRMGMEREELIDPFVCKQTAIARGKELGSTEAAMCGICLAVCPWTMRYMVKINTPNTRENVTLALATAEDAPSMVEIQKAAFARLYEQYHDENSPYLRGTDDILVRLPLPHWRIYKILSDDELVGAIYIRLNDDNSYYLNRIYVDPKKQSQGIASRAIMLAEKLLPRRPKWTVDFPADQPMNRRCYKKAGFADTGKREVISDTLTLALYEKGRAT